MRLDAWLVRALVATLTLASACSGPTSPSRSTPSPSAATPPASPGSIGITFVSSDPAPGGEATMTEDSVGSIYLRELRMQFMVQFDAALPDAKLEVELFGEGGQQCAYAFVDRAIPANLSVAVPVDTVFDWQFDACPFPAAIASVRATLLTLRDPIVNQRLTRTDYIVQSFPIRYSVRRYPAQPPNAPAAAPTISDLGWRAAVPAGGGDPPLPGDWVNVSCTARATDGAALTITITVTWDTLAAQPFTSTFPAGASSSPEGARFPIGVTAPDLGKTLPHAKVECVATNDRGQSARRTTDIGTAAP